MLAIGQALQDQVAWFVDTGFYISVQSDLNLNPHWQPSDEELGRWGMLPGVKGGIVRRYSWQANYDREAAARLKSQREEGERNMRRSSGRRFGKRNSRRNLNTLEELEETSRRRRMMAQGRHSRKTRQRQLQEMDLNKDELFLPSDQISKPWVDYPDTQEMDLDKDELFLPSNPVSPPSVPSPDFQEIDTIQNDELFLPEEPFRAPWVELDYLDWDDLDTKRIAAEIAQEIAEGYHRWREAEEMEFRRALAVPGMADADIENQASKVGSLGGMDRERERALRQASKNWESWSVPVDDGDTFKEGVLRGMLGEDQMDYER